MHAHHRAVELRRGGEIVRRVVLFDGINGRVLASFCCVNGALIGSHYPVPDAEVPAVNARMLELADEWHAIPGYSCRVVRCACNSASLTS